MDSELLRDRIVCSIRDSCLCKQLLQKKTLTLTSCIDLCQTSEVAVQQIKIMTEEQEIHGVSQTESKCGKNPESKATISSLDCRYCGLRHGRGRGKRLAFGKTCISCGKKNHFAHVCQRSGSSRARSDTENIQRVNDT